MSECPANPIGRHKWKFLRAGEVLPNSEVRVCTACGKTRTFQIEVTK